MKALTRGLAATLCIGCVRAGPGTPASAGTNSSGSTVIQNVTVIDVVEGRLHRNHVVVIVGSEIVQVGPRDGTPVPRGARRLDGGGGYVVPGLADMHVHIRHERELSRYLAYGVTTVLNLAVPVAEAPTLLRYRREILAGERLGPTLYTSGPVLDGRPAIRPPWSESAGTPSEADSIVRRQKEEGFDFVKTYNWLEPDAFAAAVAAARDVGIGIGGHLPQKVSLQDALAARIPLLAHGNLYFRMVLDSTRRLDDARMREAAALTKAAGTAVTPTIIVSAAFAAALRDSIAALTDPEARFVDSSVLADWRTTTPGMHLRFISPPSISYPATQGVVRALDAANVPILVGSDYPAMQGIFPGRATIEEIGELHRAGLSVHRALRAATIAAGDFVRAHIDSSARFGQVLAGYRADLLLLRRNPLEDLSALNEIAGIMVRGRWLTLTDLTGERR